jgi:hypothetical protein
MVEHFINAALSKSWIEAQPLPPRLSVSGRGTEIDIKRTTISCVQGNAGSEQNGIED